MSIRDDFKKSFKKCYINMRINYALLLALIIFVTASGCANIDHSESLDREIGITQEAGVGDAIVKITSEKSLPNAFGKADLYGRTTPTGITAIIYRGLEQGDAVFIRRSADIETGATTMNSTPVVIPNYSTTTHTGMVGGYAYSGQSTTYGGSTVIPANTPDPIVAERPVTYIRLTPPDYFIAEGFRIDVLAADQKSVKYRIDKIAAEK